MRQLTTRVRTVRSVLAASAAACVIFVTTIGSMPTTAAFAAPGVGDGTPPAAGALATPESRKGERLERLFKREHNVLTREQNRLTRAGQIATRIQNYINNQKANGKDTSALETALANFNTAVATAQSDHDTAKNTLDASACFDSNGAVTDIAQARVTVRTAGKAERQFYLTMRKAIRGLQKAIRDYRHANRPNSQGAQVQ